MEIIDGEDRFEITCIRSFRWTGGVGCLPDWMLDRLVPGGPQPIDPGNCWFTQTSRQLVIRTDHNGYLNVEPASLVIEHGNGRWSSVALHRDIQ